MRAIAAPSDKRFRRAHLKPARRRVMAVGHVGRMARILAAVGIMAYAGWRATTLVLGAPAFRVARVEVHGNSRLSTGEVLALVEGLQQRNILTVRLDDWRRRLMSSPWVEDATLRRLLPSTIDIVVQERHPIGIGKVGRGLYLVDRHGVIVDEYGPNYADLDLPVINGLTSASRGGRPAVDQARAQLAARLIAALQGRPEIAAKVSEIDVTDPHDAVVILEGDTAMLRLGEDEFVERLQEYIELAPALRERVPDIDYVDLRFGERLYVRPVAGTKRRAIR